MFRAVFKTSGTDVLSLVLRLILAVEMFPHGMAKLFGWFSGYGFSGTMSFFTEVVGLPYFIGLLIILAEAFGPVFLLFGLGVRIISLSYALIMIGAILMVHGQYGFLMNWTGQQAGEGFQFHLLMIAVAIALLFNGAGKWSLDQVLYKRSVNNGLVPVRK